MPSFLSRAFDSRYSKVSTHPFGRVAPLIGSENATFEKPYIYPFRKLVSAWILGYPLTWLLLQLAIPDMIGDATPISFVSGWFGPLIASTYLGICWSIRRLHDGDHSGFQLLVPLSSFAVLLAALLIGVFLGQFLAMHVGWINENVAVILLMSVIGSVTGGIALVRLKKWSTDIYDAAGSPGDNKYGSPARKT
jgi:predicted lipid-binding transport protein (Tim44 family)